MTNNPHDDLENFDDSQFDDLESELDASYDEPLPDDMTDDLSVEDEMPQDEDFGTDDNWDDQAADMQGDDQPQEKKKSSLLTYAIIGVVVLGGGAFALSQFGGSAPAPESAEIAAENAMPGTPLEGLRDEAAEQGALEPVQDTAAVPAPVEAPQGFMNEAPSLPPGPALTAVGDAPEIVPPADTLPPVPSAPVAEAPADPAVISGLKPVSDFPSVDQIKKSDSAAIAPPALPTETAEPVLAPTPVPAAPATNSAELTVMQGKLDAAQSKIDALEKELSAAKTAPAPDNNASESVITELEEKVTSLEKKLTARDNELAKARKAAEAVPVPAAREPETPTASPRRSEESAPVAAVRPAPVVKQAVSWELRGAQPGKVLLSRKGMGDDVRSVSIGDTVPGLGKIVSIDRTSAGWVVKGTQGSVAQ